MQFTGGCYCGRIRYEAEGEPAARGECLCRECQYISGGGPNFFLVMRPDQFRYTAAAPSTFRRDDLDDARTREFCPTCGTHLTTRRPDGTAVIIKVGTLDDPATYGQPDFVIQMADAQPFHCVAEGIPRHDRFAPR